MITVGVVPFHFFKPQNIALNVWALVESTRTQFARIVRELASVMCKKCPCADWKKPGPIETIRGGKMLCRCHCHPLWK